MGDGIKVVASNKKAHHDFFIEESYDAGLVLMGTEIKSIRAGHINLKEGFVEAREGELWLMGVHINIYDQGKMFGHTDPLRPRKLLLHKKEIARIVDRSRERGYTIVPLTLYLERGRAKVKIALAKGKKLYDKRETVSKRDADRQIQRALKGQY